MGRTKGALNTKTKREVLDKKYPGEGWASEVKSDKEVKARYEAEKVPEEQATE